MAEFDHGFKIIARESGRALARVAGFDCRQWKPCESTLQATTERLADRVFLARQGKERFAVYLEFVTTWNRGVPWSILGKAGLIAKRERKPVVSLIFVLQPRGYVPQNGTMKLSVGGKATQQVWFTENRLWDIEPEPWWEDEPGLMAMYPLCRHHVSPSQAILHAAEVIEQHEPDGVIRADLMTSLGIFGRLAYPGMDALSLIGRDKMKESKAYQEILDEGRADNGRTAVLTVIEERFGKRASASFRPSLNTIDDISQLDRILRLVLKCSSLDDVKKYLPVRK